MEVEECALRRWKNRTVEIVEHNRANTGINSRESAHKISSARKENKTRFCTGIRLDREKAETTLGNRQIEKSLVIQERISVQQGRQMDLGTISAHNKETK